MHSSSSSSLSVSFVDFSLCFWKVLNPHGFTGEQKQQEDCLPRAGRGARCSGRRKHDGPISQIFVQFFRKEANASNLVHSGVEQLFVFVTHTHTLTHPSGCYNYVTFHKRRVGLRSPRADGFSYPVFEGGSFSFCLFSVREMHASFPTIVQSLWLC